MIQLKTGTTSTIVISPRVVLPHGYTGILEITLKCRATGAAKTARYFTQSYGDAPRSVTMTLQVTDGAEDLNGGVIKLAGTDYPAGYYSYIVYQKDSRGDDPQVIDVGVAYLDRNTNDDGKVTYPTANTTLQYKTYEK